MTSRTPGGTLSTDLRELMESQVIKLSSYMILIYRAAISPFFPLQSVIVSSPDLTPGHNSV